MIAPGLTLTPNGSKKAWPPQKTPQNDEYVFCQLKNKNLFPQKGATQLSRMQLSSEGAEQLLGCSVAQIGCCGTQLNAAYLRGTAQLNRVQCRSFGCSGAQEGTGQLSKMQCSSEGCSLAQRKEIRTPGRPSSGLGESFGGVNKKQRRCEGRGGAQRPCFACL